uniref:Ribosomal RNA adenine dimethylase domain containing 1 n=1 Tax=Sphaeramia orbicularis TaxID=375764 RepID=A0A673A746_9TELE
MFTPSLSSEQQRDLAIRITTFLSQYSHLSDAYIIEFFTEDLWSTLPCSWQPVLKDLSYPQIADLLLDISFRLASVPPGVPVPRLMRWRFPRQTRVVSMPEEFCVNHSQSSLLGHIFRKHVKPKKQHEIRKLGVLVKDICEQTECSRVVDGHLTRFMSFGLGLSVTAIEADHNLVSMKCSSQLPTSQSSPCHVAGWVNPNASWEDFLKQLKTSNCGSEGSPKPSGPSKKRLKHQRHAPDIQGSEACACPDNTSPSQSFDRTSQQQQSQTSSSENCGSHVQPVCEDVSDKAEDSPQAEDFVLTGLHACGDLSTTLLRHFVKCPHVRGITSVACCYMKITTRENPVPPGVVEGPIPPTSSHQPLPAEFGYPMSSWVRGLPGHPLSYKAREGACHAIEDYVRRLREDSQLLRTHCYRAMLEAFIRNVRPDLRRAGIQTIKKAHLLPFAEYARLGLVRVGLPAMLPLDAERMETMLDQQVRVVVYFSLSMLLAPVVETLVLLDRMIYLQENGVDSQLIPLFNPNLSPRNFVLVALKSQ